MGFSPADREFPIARLEEFGGSVKSTTCTSFYRDLPSAVETRVAEVRDDWMTFGRADGDLVSLYVK
jgi:hypothetical protein